MISSRRNSLTCLLVIFSLFGISQFTRAQFPPHRFELNLSLGTNIPTTDKIIDLGQFNYPSHFANFKSYNQQGIQMNYKVFGIVWSSLGIFSTKYKNWDVSIDPDGQYHLVLPRSSLNSYEATLGLRPRMDHFNFEFYGIIGMSALKLSWSDTNQNGVPQEVLYSRSSAFLSGIGTAVSYNIYQHFGVKLIANYYHTKINDSLIIDPELNSINLRVAISIHLNHDKLYRYR